MIPLSVTIRQVFFKEVIVASIGFDCFQKSGKFRNMIGIDKINSQTHQNFPGILGIRSIPESDLFIDSMYRIDNLF